MKPTINPTYLVSLIATHLAACDGTPPVQVSQLSLSPGCYQPYVSGTCEGVTSSTTAEAVCELAREANATREEDILSALAPYVDVADALHDEPTAESWTVDHASGATAVTMRVTSEHRGWDAGVIRVDYDDAGPSEPTYGAYTPNGSMFDLKSTFLRWTDHALQIGNVDRGCDPATGISWDTRYADDGYYQTICWGSAGVVDCSTVNLWPL